MVLDAVLVRKYRDTAFRITEALVLSLIIYGITSLFVNKLPVSITTSHDATSKATSIGLDFNATSLLCVIIVSLALPFALGHLFTARWFMDILRTLKITRRTGRETTWLDVFLDQKRYVIVNLSNGRRIFGWPLYYSDDREEGMLYLTDTAWYNESGEPEETQNHGILLVKRDNIDHIEFTTLDRQTAREASKKE